MKRWCLKQSSLSRKIEGAQVTACPNGGGAGGRIVSENSDIIV